MMKTILCVSALAVAGCSTPTTVGTDAGPTSDANYDGGIHPVLCEEAGSTPSCEGSYRVACGQNPHWELDPVDGHCILVSDTVPACPGGFGVAPPCAVCVAPALACPD